MTATYKDNGGAIDGSNRVFTYDFPVLQTEDVQVALNGVTISQAKFTTTLTPAEITFSSTTASDVQEASGAPKTGVAVKVYRKTTVGKADGNENPKAVFAAGSSIRAGDLNLDVTQSLFGIHELQNRSILREDLIDDIIDGTKIKDGAIADEHIQATAEIQVSKLKNGATRQVLQTATNGTDVEWTDNVNLPGTLDVTGVVDFDQTLNVDGATTIGGTLGVTGESTLASATVSDLTSGRIVFSSSGGALIDNADLTFDTTGDGHLKVGVDGGYGTITCATINATYWNGENEDAFWKVNKNHIDHYGKDTSETFHYRPAIRIRKDDGNLSSTHTFSIAKDYTFEIGNYVNEGLTFGNFNSVHKNPCFKVKHAIDEPKITKMGDNYSYSSDGAEHGEISLGDGTISYSGGGDTALAGTTISLGGFTYFNARRGNPTGGGSNNHPEDANSRQPVLMLSGQRGAMFVHPENVSHLNSSSTTSTGLSYLAYGAGGHGVRSLGDNYNYGDDGYKSEHECILKLEAAADLQIIVGGARVKNKFEIGSSSVNGTLSLSGTDISATASQLNVLNGITSSTNELNILTGVTATSTELNIVDGMTKATSLTSNSDTEFPTSKAVADHITGAIAPLGGFEAIANEDDFPAIPAAGVIISIADATGITVNSSGVSTTARTTGNGSDNVTINGFPDTLKGGNGGQADPFPLPNNTGLLVVSTGSSNTYDFHRLLPTSADVKQLSDDINDFFAVYRIDSSAPDQNNNAGDLYYDTTLKKMKVYNAVDSQWDDVAQSSTSYIVTLSESFNGTLQDFTMSTAATDAQSTLVSINGVIQKPNAGTSTPSEGFAISGSTLKLAAAPPTGSDYFVVVLGDTVSIGTPSDGTVTSDKIAPGEIANTHISGSAAIEGSKLDNPLHFADNHKVSFGNLGGTADLEIYHNSTGDLSTISNSHANGLAIRSNVITLQNASGDHDYLGTTNEAEVTLYYDNSPKFATKSAGVQVTGQLMNFTSGTAILLGDGAQLELGSENDLKIWHNANDASYIRNEYGNFIIQANAAGDDAIHCIPNGSVKLFWDNEEKIITHSWGAAVKDHTNTNTWLALQTSAGNVAYVVGYSDLGTGSNETGIGLLNTSGGDKFLLATNDKEVELYYDGSKKLETKSWGVNIEGGLKLNTDTEELYIGTGDDLRIYHRNNNSWIRDMGEGNLYLDTNNGDRVSIVSAGSETNGSMAKFHKAAAVELFYNGAKRISTTGDGASVGPHASNDTWLQVIRDTWAQQCGLILKDSSGNTDARDWYIYQRPSSNSLEFYTTGANQRRMSLTSLGYLKAGDTVTWTDAISCHEVTQSAANWTLQSYNGNSTNPYGIQVYFPGRNTASDDADNLFINCHDNTTGRFRVFGSGDSENQNNSWGQISDIKLKENIVDASSQWDDIKNLKVRNFNFKESSGYSTHKQIGVVAQEIETISPGLVKENVDRDVNNNDLGTTTKSVRYSVLYMKAIKALQEAMAKIETLETKVAALEAK